MTQVPLQDGKVVLRDGKAGTEAACCCGSCCRCSAGEPPFVDASCKLQAVILQFDLSRLGVCKGAATLRLEAADVDLGFPFSKAVTVDTAGGSIQVAANMWCLNGCVYVQFNITQGLCNFCFPGSGTSMVGDIRLTGANDDHGICCPVGATYRLGPGLTLCPNAEVRVDVTCVY